VTPADHVGGDTLFQRIELDFSGGILKPVLGEDV
jgi:hypothetical protein